MLNVKKAFSLMELIIVIAIISIMTVVGLVSYQDSRKDRELERAAMEVSATIREAQNNALTGRFFNQNEIPCYFGVTNKIDNIYGDQLAVRTDQYQIFYYYRTREPAGSVCNLPGYRDKINLPDAVQFNTIQSAFPIGFGIPYSQARFDSDLPIRIELKSDNNRYINVCRGKKGEIFETKIGKSCDFN